ncbi:MAG: hypothetical protein JWP90_1457 [Mycetocola sp.]|nr:hypothetical protein [Mycetocola sp.]
MMLEEQDAGSLGVEDATCAPVRRIAAEAPWSSLSWSADASRRIRFA